MTLARSLSDGNGHYFLDFAFPVSQLIAAGAISSPRIWGSRSSSSGRRRTPATTTSRT